MKLNLLLCAFVFLSFTRLNAQNNCLVFNGTNGYVETPGLPVNSITNTLSVCARIKPTVDLDTYSSYVPIITKDNDGSMNFSNGIYLYYYDGSLYITINCNFGGYSSLIQTYTPITLKKDIWYYITATYSASGKLYLYIDGDYKSGTSNSSVKINIAATPLWIGKCTYATTAGIVTSTYFNGSIDDVSIWNKNLTSDEIKSQITKPLSGAESGLVAYYNFDQFPSTSQKITTLPDLTTNKLDGTLYNLTGDNTSWVLANYDYIGKPKKGQGISLNGSSKKAVGKDIDFSGDFTISAWINPSTFGTYAPIISKQTVAAGTNSTSEFFLALTSTRFLTFYMSNAGSTVGVNFPAYSLTVATWHYVSVTMSGGVVSLYLDGVLLGTQTFVGTRQNGTLPFEIGHYYNGTDRYFWGYIDEVSIWSKALSIDEINTCMKSNLTGAEPSILAYYDFDYQDGTIVENKAVGTTDYSCLLVKAVNTDWIRSNIFTPTFTSLSNVIIKEHSVLGTEIITATAVDYDEDQLTYSTTSTDINIDPITGLVTIKDNTKFDYEKNRILNFPITVSDNVKTATQTLVVNLENIEEIATGINTPDNEKINVYSNAVSHSIVVETFYQNTSIEIYSTTGVLLHKETTAIGTQIINQGLTKGVVIVKIKAGNITKIKKIILQ